MHKIRIHVFGTPSVYCDEKQIIFPYKKAEALFYLMAVENAVSRSRAIELLWSGKADALAKKDLRNAIYTLKKIFAFDILSKAQKNILCFSEEAVIENDYTEFVEKADLNRYTDLFLHGFFVKDAKEFEEWIIEKQELLQKTYLVKLNHQILVKGEEDIYEMELLAERYLQQNPLDENVYYSLMKVYEREEMYYKGIEVYQKLKKILNEELGISPKQEIYRLYQKLSEEWLENSVEDEDDYSSVQMYRTRELQKLYYEYTAFLEGKAGCILICGEEGVGKSHLLSQFLKDTDGDERLLLKTSCLRSEKEFPLQLWSVLLSQISDYVEQNEIEIPSVSKDAVNLLFPIFGVNVGPASELSMDLLESSTFGTFRNGLISMLQYLARMETIVIAVDNLQFVDQISFYILTMLMRIAVPNIFVIVTLVSGTEEESDNVLKELASIGLLEKIELQRLSGTDQGTIEAAQKKVCEEQLWSEFESTEKKLLNLLSIMEVGMSVEMMSRIYGEEFVNVFDSLYSLRSRKIVRETMYSGHVYFQFSDSRFKNYVYQSMEDSKKQIFHDRIGMVLEQMLNVSLDGNRYKRMIYHFEKAKNEGKVLYYELCSIEEMIVQVYDVYPVRLHSFYSRGMKENRAGMRLDQLRDKLFSGEFESFDNYSEMCVRYYYSRSCYCISRGSYEQGVELIKKGLLSVYTKEDTAYQLNFYRLMVYWGIQTQRLDVMKEYLRCGLELANESKRSFEEAVFLRMKGLYQMMCGNYEASTVTLQSALDQLQHIQLDRQTKGINVAAVYNYLGEAYRRRKLFSEAEPYYVMALQSCSESGCQQNATFYMNLATVHLGRGEEEKAFQTFLQADALYEASLIVKGRVITKSYLAMFYAKKGRLEKALDYLRDAEKFTAYLKSPGENGIYYRILGKMKAYYKESMGADFDGNAADYEEKGCSLLARAEGFYEIENLYLNL